MNDVLGFVQCGLRAERTIKALEINLIYVNRADQVDLVALRCKLFVLLRELYLKVLMLLYEIRIFTLSLFYLLYII